MHTTERLFAWEQLGITVPPTHDALEALQAAQLAGWNVRKEPMYLLNGQKVTGRYQYAVVRDTPGHPGEVDVLGQVGAHYHPVQNEQQAGLLQAITDESGAQFATLGQLDGGKRVFVTMKLPNTITVGGRDAVDLYLAVFNSHDGQSSFQFMVTPVRVECANMQQAAGRQALTKFSVRHTLGGAQVAVDEARMLLDITFAYTDEFEREAQRLFEQEYTAQQFSRLTASLFPTRDTASEAQKSRAAEHRAALSALFSSSPTAASIRGTRWGAYQAVTEYTDHVMPVRNVAGEALRINRAQKAINSDSPANKLKARTWELLTASR
jgi:phage/plasmid-like protein (TIGR03299 family)